MPLLRTHLPRRPRARSRRPGATDGESMVEAAFLELPYPGDGVVDEDSLTEQTPRSRRSLPERPLVARRLLLRACRRRGGARTSVGRLGIVWFDAHGDLNTPGVVAERKPLGDAAAHAARLGHGGRGGRGSGRGPEPRPARRRRSSPRVAYASAKKASRRRSTAWTPSTSRSTATCSSPTAAFRCSCPSREGSRPEAAEAVLRRDGEAHARRRARLLGSRPRIPRTSRGLARFCRAVGL